MKSAAKCANPCEPQNTWSIEILNVNGGPASLLGPHLTEGRSKYLNRVFWSPGGSLKRCSTVRPRTRALTLGNDRSVRVFVLGDRSSLDASSPMTQMKIAVRLCDRARVGGECPKT